MDHEPPHPIIIVGGRAGGLELATRLGTTLGKKKKARITLLDFNRTHIWKPLPHEVAAGERVVKVGKDELFTEPGKVIPAYIKVRAAGIKDPDFLKDLDGLESNHLNPLEVKQNLQTTRDENIFAPGDCAACPWPEINRLVPPRAQTAHQQASLLVKSLRNRLAGKALSDFKYYDYGSLVSLGKYNTVGNIMGNLTGSVMVEGFIARMVYLSLYKLHQLALFGFYRTMMLSSAHLFRSTVHPGIKLH